MHIVAGISLLLLSNEVRSASFDADQLRTIEGFEDTSHIAVSEGYEVSAAELILVGTDRVEGSTSGMLSVTANNHTTNHFGSIFIPDFPDSA